MTPHEHAERFARKAYEGEIALTLPPRRVFEQALAAEIRAAVEEEREACARLCEERIEAVMRAYRPIDPVRTAVCGALEMQAEEIRERGKA